MAAEYGLSNVDSPKRWSTSFTYEMPFGKGKKWLGSNRALNYVVGGWSANAVGIYQTGFPLQITQSSNNGHPNTNPAGNCPSGQNKGDTPGALHKC